LEEIKIVGYWTGVDQVYVIGVSAAAARVTFKFFLRGKNKK
jgi:hypothetical protein